MYFDWPFAIIIGIPLVIIIEILRFIKCKKSKIEFINLREIALLIFSAYIIGLIAVTLFPFDTYRNVKPTANLVPVFNTIKDISGIPADMKGYMTKFWIRNVLGNLFLLTPLAILVPIIFKKFRSIKSVVYLCLFVSILIEALQYLSMFLGNIRSVDIDDVILNTLGSIIGFYIFNYFLKSLKPRDAS